MVKVSISCLLLVAGVALAAPQYSYQPPSRPSGLYSLPTTTYRPPPPPTRPPQLYSAPPPPTRPPQLYSAPPPPTRPPQLYSAPPPTYVRPQARPAPAAMKGMLMPYDFQYGVHDAGSGNSFSHFENSDGKTTQGEYRVLLPDGRTQVVTFYDNGGGFNADVTYV